MYSKKNVLNKIANNDFLVKDEDELMNGQTLRNLVTRHKQEQLPRLELLEAYYLNLNTDILEGKRRLDVSKSDYRIAHNFARYVSRFIVGYLTGNPITFKHTDESTLEQIYRINDINDADAVNSDLALNLSIYGRAYEIVYRNHEDKDTFKLLDPKSTFAVYDNSLDKKLIAGVRYYKAPNQQNELVDHIELYTKDDVKYYTLVNGEYRLNHAIQHYYKDVQIIEYLNDQFKQGDFENVLSEIDAYDAAQSDTANYMSDTNDAMLAIVGNVDLDTKEAREYKDANMVIVKPEVNANGSTSNADVKYIYKQYDVAGSEAYKKRLQDDIHKFTNTPNLNDENFSGVASGESMKYKLFGLEQMRAIKERLMKKGLMRRYKLLFNNINLEGLQNHEYKDMQIAFTPNLPKALKESVDIFNSLSEGVSQETRLSVLDIIENPLDEIEKMQEEEENLRKRDDEITYKDTFDNNSEEV